MKENPITLNGTVRIGEVCETPEDVLDDLNAQFYMNGKEIPVNLVPANMIGADTLNAKPLGDSLFSFMGSSTNDTVSAIQENITQLGAMQAKIVEMKESGEIWDENDLGLGDLEQMAQGCEQTITTLMSDLQGDDLTNIANQIGTLTAALANPDLDPATAEQYRAQLDGLLDVVQSADQYLGTGNNISAGIAEGMTAYGWDGDASTLASNLESAVNSAFGIASPAASMNPIGDNVAAGVGVGMVGHDFSSDTSAMASNLLSAASASINGNTLRSIGMNAMRGLISGINSGRSGVVSAMREAARAAVNAAKSEL